MKKTHPGKFFRQEEEATLVNAIKEAEAKSSGEIRVHLTKCCDGSPEEAGAKLFEKLGMTRTAERNGILIYLALKSRKFAILGDRGIHEKVGADFWYAIRDAMQEEFRRGEFVKGLLHGIQTCGAKLGRYFPHRADDHNELPNDLSQE